MKPFILLVALALGFGSAHAADLPSKRAPSPPPSGFLSAQKVSSWTGFYAGALAGVGMGDVSDASVSPITNADLSPITGKLHRSGALAGVQVGYGFMTGPIHVGVEADMALTTIGGAQTASGVYNAAPASARLTVKTDVLSSLRGRVGYVFNDVLIYGTGGMASALQKSTFSVTQNDTGVSFTSSGAAHGWRVGWVVGLGAERFFTSDISGKLEYLYAHVGDGIRARFNPNGVHLLRGGVNYHF
jgi:outer membrane immunogenic protein